MGCQQPIPHMCMLQPGWLKKSLYCTISRAGLMNFLFKDINKSSVHAMLQAMLRNTFQMNNPRPFFQNSTYFDSAHQRATFSRENTIIRISKHDTLHTGSTINHIVQKVQNLFNKIQKNS